MLDEQGGVKATWFVLGWEAERRPGMVRRIAERGHEIGCHSYWHREVFDLTREQFREDTQRAQRAIEQAAGQSVLGYRAPSFSITKASLWALDVLAELGFRYDSSVFPVLHPRYGVPDASPFPRQLRCGDGVLWELPPATTPFFGRRMGVAGGGYVRHLPPFVAESGLRHLTRREKQPAVLYLHPWEIDPDQPVLSVGWLTRLRHYRNLSRTEGRFERLLDGFEFWTCERLVEALDHTGAAVERAPAAVRPASAGVRVPDPGCIATAE
jgi:polysaccharide deacetylase family protein (PEP-CTERM system associated)